MSAFPDSEIGLTSVRSRALSPKQFAAVATVAAILGASTIWPAISALWEIWTTDALKSIGMAVPLVSLVLILRAWRALGWQTEGTWWGLPMVLIAIAGAIAEQQAVLLLVISPNWATPFPPPALVLLAYGSGIVLLAGGVSLFRAALFPILLLWFANPIPHIFSLWVDLPLQTVSAHIARAFAMHLGQPLTPDHLRLMFTPEFGMFIAPGCNGIRGSVTMGFVALIAGYVYRFRWYINALVVAGAVLLGYVFNLARLCLLVLYYLVALHFPSLQDKAKNADYLIGGMLFFLATMLLFTVIHHLRASADQETAQARPALQVPAQPVRYAPLVALAAIALFGCVGLARAMAVHPPPPNPAAEQFPTHLGSYTLIRTWKETLDTGPVIYVWAQYAPANGGSPVAIGLSPLVGWQHDTLLCHATRGEHPLWQGQLAVATRDAAPVNFSTGFYNDGVTQSFEASTQCSAGSCGEFATERTHFGFVYSHPDPSALLSPDGQKSVPVLLRVETIDTSVARDAARQQLTQDLRNFLASVRLEDLARAYIR